ncbi:hypothetical protein OG607_05705 [Streptomyces sp. NBC_01537]|uniref:hypothetical protein n=1 Tax=Streptomyces sp. NBC_01537 TaxID=2903896 RepID=UPI00386BF39E
MIKSPNLPGYLDYRPDGRYLRVWCAWCVEWHCCRAGDLRPAHITHTVGQCYAPDSPYRAGYGITVSLAPFDAVVRSVREATAADRKAIVAGRIDPAIAALRAQRPREELML